MAGIRFDRRFAAVTMAALIVGSLASAAPVAGDAALGVETEAATDATDAGATLRGNVTALDGADSATVHFTYWKAGQKDATLTWWTGDAKSSPGPFSADVSLDAGTTYEYRAYVESADGVWKAGSVREVTTAGRSFGAETGETTDVAPSSATVEGNLTGLGGADSAAVYVQYWPEGNDSQTYWWTGDVRSSPGSFAAELGLAPGTTYEYRALAQDADGRWTAGAVRDLTTPDGGLGVTTAGPSALGVESATVGGNLTGLGGADDATVYVEYWRQGHEAESSWWTGDSRGSPGAFETSLDLRPGTDYEYRALARSADGRWKAGETRTLTTDGNPFVVGTGLPQNVTHDSATVTATLDGVGGADSATVYVRYWEEGREDETVTWQTGPTVSEPTSFTAALDLRSETTYNAQALARDDDGTWTTGRVYSFTTEGEPGEGEPPVAVYDLFVNGEEIVFEDSVSLDTEDTFTFDAADARDPDGEIASYEWDFDGDHGIDATGEVVNHSFDSPGDHDVRLTVTDDDGVSRSYELTVSVGDRIVDPVHRVNAGGRETHQDWGPDWAADTASNPSPYANHAASESGTVEADSSFSGYDVGGVKAYVPNSIFESNREDPAAGEEMRYAFDVEPGERYEVRVYLSELEVDGDSYGDGERRIFDVTAGGETVVEDFDSYGEFGHDGGGVRTATVTADDGTLAVEFPREQGDPAVAAIEILRVEDGEGS